LKEHNKMDPKLAQVYGTNQADETDVEALATAELTSKLAAADELNLDGMSDDEAEALASELIGSDSSDEEAPAETEEAASEEEETEETEEKTAGEETTEAQEKIAEADYLGRVMAHAYVAERREIEKQAAAGSELATVAKKGKGAAGKVMEHVKKHGKSYAAGAAGSGAGFAAGRKSKKASAEAPEAATEELSALDRLAVARAQEILKENGVDLEQEKQSSLDEEKAAQLAAKVEERAVAMLNEAGYKFEESTEE
jgi:hypothetical protein